MSEKKGSKEAKRIEELKEKVELLERERDEYLDGWRRAKADLVNFKKETAESLERFNDMMKVEFTRELMPVIDALHEAERSEIDGLVPIKNLLMSILKNEHIEAIQPAEGDEFDPEVHEATGGTGSIIDRCQQKGFKYKTHVIRPAKVTVRDKS